MYWIYDSDCAFVYCFMRLRYSCSRQKYFSIRHDQPGSGAICLSFVGTCPKVIKKKYHHENKSVY